MSVFGHSRPDRFDAERGEVRRADDLVKAAVAVRAIDERPIHRLHRHPVTRPLHRRRAAQRRFPSPGTASTAVRTSRRYRLSCSGSGKRSTVAGSRIVRRLFESKPASTFRRLKKLRIIRPDTTSSTNASATSATINESRSRRLPLLPARAAAFLLHRCRKVWLGRLQRRRHAEQEACKDRNDGREEKHAAIQRDVDLPAEVRRAASSGRCPSSAHSRSEAQHSAAHREQTFSVRNCLIRSQRPAPSEARTTTSRSRDTPRASEIREVGAADEQQEPGRGEEHQDNRAALVLRSDQGVCVALHDDAPVLVRGREVVLDALPDCVHIGSRLGERHAVLQPREEVSQWKSRVMFEGLNARGRQSWIAARSKAPPSGRTPTMVWGSLLRSTVG